MSANLVMGIPSTSGRAERLARMRWGYCVGSALLLMVAACGGSSAPARQPAPGPPLSVEAVARTPAAVAGSDAGEACGALACRSFGDAASALRYVLREVPLVLGVGEAHAPAGSEQLPTTAARFTDQLLPVLAGRASHLIVELLAPNPQCAGAEAKLEQAQKPVVAAQSRENQNDYLKLGVRARALGIEPFVLTPSCAELRAIGEAGEDALIVTLSTIATISARLAKGALVQNRKAGRDRLVVAYGGALHNDLGPSDTRASFRYGDALQNFSSGRYLALDLIVREFIKDNAAWRALPWYGRFDPRSDPERYILLSPSAHSYVLFFPAAAPGAAAH